MHLHLEHRFDAPLDVVQAASLDPAFEDRLGSLPNVGERKVTTRERRDDGSIHRIVRYSFAGPLPAPVVKAIGGGVISWDEEGDFDPDTHRWRFEIHPLILKGRIRCNGHYGFEPDGDKTLRTVDADLKVSVPLVGGRVEKAIADGLRDNMNAEAEILADYVNEL